MKYLTLILTMFLVACGSGSDNTGNPGEQPPPAGSPMEITRYDTQSSWYELKQEGFDVPKYSGVMGTYTAKHSPVAVKCELGEWATYSNNRDGNLNIYSINLDTGNSYLVHVETGTIDPHQNAAIQCVGNKLYIAVSARGYKRSGTLYSSENGINWAKESNQFWSYPQLHNINNDLVWIYTEYTVSENIVDRSIYSSCNNEKIVDDGYGHYSNSFYDGSVLHVVYNDHIGGSDKRTNLNYKKSSDGGCTWSEAERWHAGDLVYLKDLNMVNGELTALVVISDSATPEFGNRYLAKITSKGSAKVKDVNHNYTTGAINNKGFIAFPDGKTPYAGGEFLDAQYVNYIRRIHNGDGFVASEGISGEYLSDAWFIKIEK